MVQGPAWLTLQRRLIRQKNWGAQRLGVGSWGVPYKDRFTPGGATGTSGEVKDSRLFKKGILLFYTAALLKDWRVAFRVGEQQESGGRHLGKAEPLESGIRVS